MAYGAFDAPAAEATRSAPAPARARRWWAAAPAVLALAWMHRSVAARSRGDARAAPARLELARADSGGDDGGVERWEVYKLAAAVSSGTGREVFEFATRYIAPEMSAPADLGCGGLKVGCTVKCAGCSATSTMQLHWVDATHLDEHAGSQLVGGWEDYFRTLHGNLTAFNAFMHNKWQLFVADLSHVQKLLDSDGVPYLRRLSSDPDAVSYTHLTLPTTPYV